MLAGATGNILTAQPIHKRGAASHRWSRHRASVKVSRVEYCTAESWRQPLTGYGTPELPPVVTLGKFDALHRGHMSLAAAAAQQGGTPVLISFTGMAEVLGWEPRLPLVAPCDRARVLQLWSQQLLLPQADRSHAPVVAYASGSSATSRRSSQGTGKQTAAGSASSSSRHSSSSDSPAICQRYIPFSEVRNLSPEAFVEVLANELQPAGVVAGVNYRFGYRAAGDAAALKHLSSAAGLKASIVELVGAGEPGAVGVVSSSKIREMLAAGRVEAIRRCLGRHYRLVAAWGHSLPEVQQAGHSAVAPSSSADSAVTSAGSQASDTTNTWPTGSSSVSGNGSSSGTSTTSSSNSSSSSSGFTQGYGNARHKFSWPAGAEQLPSDFELTHHLDYKLVFALGDNSYCNQAPAVGIYACHVTIYSGADPDCDLLQLEQGKQAGDQVWHSEGLVEVHVEDQGVLLPVELGGSRDSSCLVAIDFVHCIRRFCKV